VIAAKRCFVSAKDLGCQASGLDPDVLGYNQGFALQYLGILNLATDKEAASEHLRDSLVLLQEGSEEHAYSLMCLGSASSKEAALTYYEQAFEEFQQLRDGVAQAKALVNWAGVAMEGLVKLDIVRQRLLVAASVFTQAGDDENHAMAMLQLARLMEFAGNIPGAGEAAAQAEVSAKRAGRQGTVELAAKLQREYSGELSGLPSERTQADGVWIQVKRSTRRSAPQQSNAASGSVQPPPPWYAGNYFAPLADEYRAGSARAIQTRSASSAAE
jgi:tetratricopeptide (TPR) repeat protein